MTVRERIEKIAEWWFLKEPAVFASYCTHQLAENTKMKCAARTGKGRIEYNPELLQNIDDKLLENLLRAEVIRILLKHPYDRQPENCKQSAVTEASDCVVTSYYSDLMNIGLSTPDSFNLKEKEAFEWYAHQISAIEKMQQLTLSFDSSDDDNDSEVEKDDKDAEGKDQVESEEEKDDDNDKEKTEEIGDGGDGDNETGESKGGQGDGDCDGKGKGEGTEDGTEDGNSEENSNLGEHSPKDDQSAMWEEDQSMQEVINYLIESTQSWGGMPGHMVEMIKASTKPQIDYRRAFAGFRSSVLSSKRNLTRMRPNRRMDFEQMGSVYKLTTRLLIAVDVSGSIGSDSLVNFYSLINRFFKYGIEHIDVVQFGADLGEVENFKKAKTTIQVCGRGGTTFQPIIDFAAQKKYDGVAIFTDGYGPVPIIPTGFRTPLLWVADCQQSYNDGHEWMEKLPHSRACWLKV